MYFDVSTITPEGKALLTSAVAGETIVWGTCICCMSVNGNYPVNIVARGSAVSAYKGENSVAQINCVVDNKGSECVAGKAYYFLLYGKKSTDTETAPETLIVKAEATEQGATYFPKYNPANPSKTTLRGIVELSIKLSEDVLVSVAIQLSVYALASDLQKLSDRVVTTHAIGSEETGEAQTIYGEKVFEDSVYLAGHDPTDCALFASKHDVVMNLWVEPVQGVTETDGRATIHIHDEGEDYGYLRTDIENYNFERHQAISLDYNGIDIRSDGKVTIQSQNPIEVSNQIQCKGIDSDGPITGNNNIQVTGNLTANRAILTNCDIGLHLDRVGGLYLIYLALNFGTGSAQGTADIVRGTEIWQGKECYDSSLKSYALRITSSDIDPQDINEYHFRLLQIATFQTNGVSSTNTVQVWAVRTT